MTKRITIYNKDNPGKMIILPEHEADVQILGNSIMIYSNQLHQAVNNGSHNSGHKLNNCINITDEIGRQRLNLTELSGDTDFYDEVD